MESPMYTTPPTYNGGDGVQRQVDFVSAIKMGFEKYAQFSGRSSRSEFWWWALFCFLVECVGGLCNEWVASVVSLAFIVPNIAIWWRRLHDIGKGGGYWFLGLIPLVGWIILLVWACKESEPEANRFGEVPNVD